MNYITYTKEDIKDYCENVISKVEKKRNEQRKACRKIFHSAFDEELLEKYDKLLLEQYRFVEYMMKNIE